MEQGDHSNCPIELLPCPSHLEEIERYIKESGLELNVPLTRKLNALSASLRRTVRHVSGAAMGTMNTTPKLRTNISHITAPTRPRSYGKMQSDGCSSMITRMMTIAASRRRDRTAMQKRNKQPEVEVRVGIFWLFNCKLIIDSTPLSEPNQFLACD